MSEPANNPQQDAALRAQLRLFCQLMLGSADAADRVIQQISRRALDDHAGQAASPSERVRLFRLAADLCGARRSYSTAVERVPPGGADT